MKQLLSSGPFVVDLALHVVRKHGERLALTPKVFEALVVFLRSSNRVLTRDELLEALWPGQLVTEANLNQHMSMLRKALGGGASGEKFLLTVPGKGYQWLLPVEERDAPGWGKAWWAGAVAAAVVLGGLGWVMWRQKPGGMLRYRPVTRLQGAEFQPAISGDGKRVAFVWDLEGRAGAQIYLVDRDSQKPVRVSQGKGSCRSPVWSPDGMRVAYVCVEVGRGEVLITTPGGGTEKAGELHGASYGLVSKQLDWSPDGRRLAVSDKSAEREPFTVWEIDLETKKRRALTVPPANAVGDLEPRYSPDGQWLAFVRQEIRFRHALMVGPAQGGEPVTVRRENTEISGLDWSGGGRSLLYCSSPRGEYRVWKLEWHGKGGATPEATELHAEHAIQFSVSRKTNSMVYSVFHQDLDIWRLTLGQGKEEGQWQRLIASTGDDSMPQYSPDGTRICFRSNRSGEEQLWLSDAEGGEAVQVTQGNLWPTLGRWSPEGKRLTFNRYGVQECYVIWPDERERGAWRLDGGEHPSFSSDGSALIYLVEGTLRKREFGDAGKDTPIAKHTDGGYPTQSSADGRYIYYTGGRTDPSIWRADTRTGQESEVVRGLLPGCWACWSLGKDGLYYIGAETAAGANAKLLVVNPDGGQPRVLAEIPPPMPSLGTGALSVSPDGRRFLAVRVNRSNTDIYRLDGIE
ncbi:MAG: PD40 domain-containing protein [Acidobacteria bacterium]|nr:PD40 domain-containing protein [Acidobacteriota bacterium]